GKARGEAERELSFSRILLAQREWQAYRVRRAEELLDECPPALRQWEWHYLKHQCAAELLRLRGPAGHAMCLAFSADGKRLAAAGADNSVTVWDAGSGAEVATFRGHRYPVRCLSFSPDGRLLASGGGANSHGEVLLWLADSGRESLRIPHHRRSVECVA